MKKIRTLFNQLDSDEAGLITFEMLKDNFKKADVSEYFESLGLDVSDAWTFFKLLDLDRGGESRESRDFGIFQVAQWRSKSSY